MQILEFKVKKRNCKKGYPCGRSCINRARNCRNTLEGQAKNFADWLKLQGRTQKEPQQLRKSSFVQKQKDRNTKPVKTDYRKIPQWNRKDKKSGKIYKVEFNQWREKTEAIYVTGTNIIRASLNTGEGMRAETIKTLSESSNLNDVLKSKKITIKDVGDNIYNSSFVVNDEMNTNKVKTKKIKGKSDRELKLKIAQAAKYANQEILDKIPNYSIITNSPYTGDGKGQARKKIYERHGFGTYSETKKYGQEEEILQAMIKIDDEFYPIGRKANG